MSDKKKPAKKDAHRSNCLVRLTPEHYQALQRLAASNDRPLTRELARAVEAHLRQHGAGNSSA